MKRSRLEILLIMVAVLALSAGVVAGLLASRLPSTSADPIPGPMGPPAAGSLAEELNLSAAQRENMRQIWEGVHGRVRRTFDEAQSLEKSRDQALVNLLNDEQKAKFEKISNDFADRFDNLSKQRDTIFDEAVAASMKLLNQQQQKNYREILKRHVRREPPPRARIFTAPATQPSTRQTH